MLLLRVPLHKILSVLATILGVWSFELLLLEKKYNAFSGGFLQAHTLSDWGSRAQFLILSLGLDVTFFGTIAVLWFWLAARVSKRSVLASYNFAWVAGGLSGSVIGVKYELLSYLSDAVTFEVVKNIGGGSLADAIAYVFDESAFLLHLGIVALILYGVGYFVLRRRYAAISPTVATSLPSFGPRTALLIGSIATLLFAYAQTDQSLRYQMARKVSYAVLSGVMVKLTDFDGDGSGWLGFPRDTHPFDGRLYPGALDVPDNGVDEDELMGDFTKTDSRLSSAPIQTTFPSVRKNIIFIVLESGRADVLGKKVNGVPVAPNIDLIAKEGSSFSSVYSHVGYTVHSLLTMFTGKLVHQNIDRTLFTVLKDSGYEISVFSGQDESFGGISATAKSKDSSVVFFDGRSALADRVFSSAAAGSVKLDDRRVFKEVKARIDSADWSKPQFMYINFQSAHFPYRHPGMEHILPGEWLTRGELTMEKKAQVEMTYWNALANADRAIGAVVDELKSRGHFEDTLLVVTGDHGESLFDGGLLGHGTALNEIQTRIPLVLNAPNVQIQEPIGEIDFADILLRGVGLSKADSTFGGGRPRGTVFQFIGNLDRPSQIGTVENGGRRILYDFQKQAAFFSDEERWILYSDLGNDPPRQARVRELINEWELLRWESARVNL